jgi:hypothetical protein
MLHNISYRGPSGILNVVGWNEYDFFIDLSGFLVVAYYGVYRTITGAASGKKDRLHILLAAMAMVYMSLQYFPLVLAGKLPIPFISTERYTARFITLPMVVLFVYAAANMESGLRRIKSSGFYRLLFAAGVFQLFSALIAHSWIWRVREVEKLMVKELLPFSATIVQRPDPVYKAVFWVSAAISLAALAAAALRLFAGRLKKTPA